jgi:phosphoglycerate dehydrogenase-like enzyme
LTNETRHLIGETELRMMKPTSYLVNAARGAIVDQQALTRALAEEWIQGAGLDVFEDEPIGPDDPLLRLDNVILAPHALGNTDECFLRTGHSVLQSVLEASHGRIPQYVVNRDVLDSPLLQEKLRRLRESDGQDMPSGSRDRSKD